MGFEINPGHRSRVVALRRPSHADIVRTMAEKPQASQVVINQKCVDAVDEFRVQMEHEGVQLTRKAAVEMLIVEALRARRREASNGIH